MTTALLAVIAAVIGMYVAYIGGYTNGRNAEIEKRNRNSIY